jgi:predicted enzyme related to lactoylglutathione lyase
VWVGLGSGAAGNVSGMTMTYTGPVLDAPDARELADFYRRLLGWETEQDEPDWVTLRAPDGAARLSFQTEPLYQEPRWPAERGAQLMMAHLDIEVDDLATETARAVGEGAKVADFQPQQQVRVCVDPAGHPFCLWVREG